MLLVMGERAHVTGMSVGVHTHPLSKLCRKWRLKQRWRTSPLPVSTSGFPEQMEHGLDNSAMLTFYLSLFDVVSVTLLYLDCNLIFLVCTRKATVTVAHK